MWMRDAVLRDSLPTLDQLSNPQAFFPYRVGHAFWAYAAGVGGDDVVSQVYRGLGSDGLRGSIENVFQMPADTFVARWHEDTRAHYRPTLEGRTRPEEVGETLLFPSPETGGLNLAPEVESQSRVDRL